MERYVEPSDGEVFDLGSASSETQGDPGEMFETIGSMASAGISDD